MSLAAEMSAEIAVIGGGVGGVAAALAAARLGKRVLLTEETDWIGGQLTSQAVPPDEHKWIETQGATASYRAFRAAVRDYYRQHTPLTPAARQKPNLDPGDGWVSDLCHEPRVALAVLHSLLAPHIAAGRVVLLTQHKPVRVEGDGDTIRAVVLRDEQTGEERTVSAPYILDATELGDLLPMAGAEYVIGAEAQAETGEPHAPTLANPQNQQAFTCCFAVDYRHGEDHTLDRPAEYRFWRDYAPDLRPAWTGKMLSLTYSKPSTLTPITAKFDPKKREGFWIYRRIRNADNFLPAPNSGDICLINWPQNDYLLGNLVDVDEAEQQAHIARAKQLSLSLLYWLQTEAPRPDGGTGWKGLRLRKDVTGTDDGLAKRPYVRESRRIRAELTLTENHLAASAFPTGAKVATPFIDSVGVGFYQLDLHPSTGGDNYIDLASLPFQIPLGALIPQRMENLLPACKNIGTTHLSNGCYRLHPVEWSIGESAGALAAFCLDRSVSPRAVRNTPSLLADFQAALRSQGVLLEWRL